MEKFKSPHDNQEGVDMPKNLEKWGKRDVDVANNFRVAMQALSGGFKEKRDKAAQAIGFRSYMELPEGVRSYIAHIGGTLAQKRKKEDKMSKVLEEWYELYENDPSFRHAMTDPEKEPKEGTGVPLKFKPLEKKDK